MRISDWSSDVCSSDLIDRNRAGLLDRGLPSREGRGLDDAGRFVDADGDFPVRDGGGVDLHRAVDDDRAGAGVDDDLGGRVGGCDLDKIGRASGRERVCQYVLVSVVAVILKKKK